MGRVEGRTGSGAKEAMPGAWGSPWAVQNKGLEDAEEGTVHTPALFDTRMVASAPLKYWNDSMLADDDVMRWIASSVSPGHLTQMAAQQGKHCHLKSSNSSETS